MKNRKQNTSDLITLFETLGKKVHCKKYKPELNPDDEKGFYILCSEHSVCPRAINQYYHVARMPYGEKGKINVAMCDRCFGALKGHKEYLKELVLQDQQEKTDRIIDFLEECDPDEWL